MFVGKCFYKTMYFLFIVQFIHLPVPMILVHIEEEIYKLEWPHTICKIVVFFVSLDAL